MQLSYRGVAYEYTPPVVEAQKGELAGRYRGLDWKFCNPTKQYVQQPSLDLVYRGVAYQSDQSEQKLEDRSRTLMMKHQRSIKTRQQSMLTRLAGQVGLSLPEAGSYWSRIQGKVHPSFRSTYDRSGAALS
jgi:hypothetical protein